jgi:hypothetical protein
VTGIPKRVAAVAATVVLFFLFLLGLDLIQLVRELPAEAAPFVYGTIAFISLLPILLILVDLIVVNRGVLEWKDLKLDFSRTTQNAPPSFSVPGDLGLQGQPLIDSGTISILKTLGEAVASEVVVVDLETGQAWWETRLLVLAAGATRAGRPNAIVFVATEAGVEEQYIGWARPAEIVRILLNQDPRYETAYARAEASWNQWRLVEPGSANAPVPGPLPWFQPDALGVGFMAFTFDGKPNALAFEQMLGAQLGNLVESQSQPISLTSTRLRDVLAAVLHVEAIEETSDSVTQISTLANGVGEYIALTRDRRYRRLLPRVTVVGLVLKSLVAGRSPET